MQFWKSYILLHQFLQIFGMYMVNAKILLYLKVTVEQSWNFTFLWMEGNHLECNL